MKLPPLVTRFPRLYHEHRVRWIELIPEPTPVHALPAVADWIEHGSLFVKREDSTDSLYGGNKVRNLEFLLGTALARGAERVATIAPYGSNFIAALSAQCKRVGLPNDVFHFVPDFSDQMRAHAEFSAAQGTKLRIFPGGRYLGVARAQMNLLLERARDQKVHFLPVGGSDAIGALGHVNAVLELKEQIDSGEIPEPDLIVVGAGTCGTMAGLLVGLRLAGLKTRLIGIRCVDPIVCNSFRIAMLANKVSRLLGSEEPIRSTEVDLRECAESAGYGLPLANANFLIRKMQASAGITLDTTYTTKVISALRAMAESGSLQGKSVLYWHTFSASAVEKFGSASALFPGRAGAMQLEPAVERQFGVIS